MHKKPVVQIAMDEDSWSSVFEIYRKTPRFTNSISVFCCGARVSGLKRENNAERERIFVVTDGELVSVKR
jgi:hypothetical protein